MEQPSYYSILTADVRYDKRLKNHADCKILYSEITALSNKNGYCSASNKYFSKLYDRPVPTISKWINMLKDLGYLKIEMIHKDNSKEIKERRIYPISTPINANVNTYSGERLGGINADVKTPINADVKDNNTSINNINNNRSTAKAVDRVSEKQLKEDFEKLWKLYPKKVGKPQAFKAYKKFIKKKDVTNKKIQTGIVNYLKQINIQRTTKEYIKDGSTWFKNECWEDEYNVGDSSSPVNQKNNNSSAPEKRTVADIEKERRERRRDAFPIQYKNHPEWFTDEDVKNIVKEFPELREKVLEIDRARATSDSSTT